MLEVRGPAVLWSVREAVARECGLRALGREWVLQRHGTVGGKGAFEMNLCLDGAPVLWNKVQVNSENAEGSEIRKRGPGMLYFTLVPFSETHSAWITLFYLVGEGLGCDYSLSRAQGGGQ